MLELPDEELLKIGKDIVAGINALEGFIAEETDAGESTSGCHIETKMITDTGIVYHITIWSDNPMHAMSILLPSRTVN